jgi:NAD(P)-dependent dehydrogenase (short-subunit alcohol dehydrogenase family)
MDLGINQRVALVTGASKGIGKAIAQTLAAEGARVILVARTQDKLEEARSALPNPDRGHYAICADLMSDGEIARVAKEIVARVGEPDIIVHNLGGSHGVFQTFAPASDWQRVWHFNLGVAHEFNRIFLPGMIKRLWGRVVHLSTLSTRTYNGYPAYVSAKCAVDGYVKTVNREVSKHNVIVSAVAPGAIFSEGRHFARLQKEDPKALEQYFDQHLPIRRLGTAGEIASTVAFLCSDQATFAAGSIVAIDGGGM